MATLQAGGINDLEDNSDKARIKVAGWTIDDSPTKTGKGRRKKEDTVTAFEEEDERLKQDQDNDDLFNAIPDIEVLQEEEMSSQVAAPPSVAKTRITTYKQLDMDLQKHAGLFTLDGEVDLKLLAKVLSPESEIKEDEKEWEWDKLFAEISPDIQKAWDTRKD